MFSPEAEIGNSSDEAEIGNSSDEAEIGNSFDDSEWECLSQSSSGESWYVKIWNVKIIYSFFNLFSFKIYLFTIGNNGSGQYEVI